jgi:carboxypeptidase Taq
MSLTAYERIEARFREISLMGEIMEALSWDQEVYMAEGSVDSRAEQLALLSGRAHELLTRSDWEDLLGEADVHSDSLTNWQQANLREARREWIHAAALPGKLVEALTLATSRGEVAWRNARNEDNFSIFVPHLKKILELTRETAFLKAEALNTTSYNALVDQFQPGLTTNTIDPVFDSLKDFLPGFLVEVQHAQNISKDDIRFKKSYSGQKQEELSLRIMDIMGFDFNRGRLDISAHPFTTGHPLDTRITTAYREHDPLFALTATIHETGHALYELNRPLDWRLQPVGYTRGMVVHEAMSLFMEKMVALTPEFIQFIAPVMQKVFGDFTELSFEHLYQVTRQVQPGYIRIEADEVTYPLHVILRYELEQLLFDDKLKVEDIPEAWNDMMNDYLGIRPPDNAQGCLQDIHWAHGAFGYFPCYTLGAIMGSQLFAGIKKEYSNTLTDIRQGHFAGIVNWLRENIYDMASLLPFEDLVLSVSGQPISAEPFIKHLSERYEV